MLRFLIFTLIVVLSGCTVTKRVHRPGWRVEWRSVQKAPQKHNLSGIETENSDGVKFKEEAIIESPINSSEIDSNERIAAEESSLTSKLQSSEPVDSITRSDAQQSNEKASFSLTDSDHFIKEYSLNEKTVASSNQKANRRYRDGKGLYSLGLIIMWLGVFFFVSVLIAWANFSFIQLNTIWGFILYILFALIGFLLIQAFGLIPAIITSLCIALAGGIIAIVGHYMNR